MTTSNYHVQKNLVKFVHVVFDLRHASGETERQMVDMLIAILCPSNGGKAKMLTAKPPDSGNYEVCLKALK